MFSGLQRTQVSRYDHEGNFISSINEKRTGAAPAGLGAANNINGFRFSKCPDGKCGKKKSTN
jgi:hypothetical protein